MGYFDFISLSLIMISLAAIPSSSVALVVTRSAMCGIPNGIAVSVGIVVGDLVFILLALLGLAAIAETLGGFFVVVRYLGGAYLLWTGYLLLSAKTRDTHALPESKLHGNLVVSFFSGLLLTLGDVKAILFYVSLFPAFVDLTDVSAADLLMIFFITVVSVGGVKVVYAISARRLAKATQGMMLQKGARIMAGSFMIGAGSYLILKT